MLLKMLREGELKAARKDVVVFNNTSNRMISARFLGPAEL